MDATAHLVAGAAVGVRFRPPWALLAGLVSHAILDAIPHANYTGWRPLSFLLVADVLLGAGLVLLLAIRKVNRAGVIAGAVGGIIPPLERHFSGQFEDFLARPPLSLPDVELPPPLGFVTQGIVIGLALLLSFGTRQRG